MKWLLPVFAIFILALWVYLEPRAEILDPATGSGVPHREVPPPDPNLNTTVGGVSGGANSVRTEVAAPLRELETDQVLTVKAIVEDREGKLLQGVHLIAKPRDSNAFAVSDEHGELVLGLSAPDIREVRYGGGAFLIYGQGFTSIEIFRGIPNTGEFFLGRFTLEPGGRLIGRVLGSDGGPVEGASVFCSEPVLDRAAAEVDLRRVYGSPPLSTKSITGVDGRFLLEGVAPSTYSVTASAKGTLFSFSGPVDVVADEVAQVPDITLFAADPAHRIEGVVLGADSAAQVGVVVSLFRSDVERRLNHCRSDSTGAFSFPVEAGAQYTVKAGKTGYDPIFAYNVEPGTHDLVLRPREKTTIRVIGTGVGGRALSMFGADARLENGKMAPGSFGVSKDGGPLDLLLPQKRFTIQVAANGYRLFNAGPFDPEDPPAIVEARLVPVSGITGIVLAEGHPVAGARVDAHGVRDVGYAWLLGNGLHNQFDGNVRYSTVTDEDGRFVVGIRPDLSIRNGISEVHFHARDNGYAFSSMSAVLLQPNLDAIPEVVLSLRQTGSMTGQVGIADQDLRGSVIAISQGDEHVLTCPIGVNGEYQFSDLAPGRWQAVLSTEATVVRGGHEVVDRIAIEKLPWSFDVREGLETQFNLADAGESERIAQFKGHLLLNGDLPIGWTWKLYRQGEDRGGRFESDGHFTSQLSKPGRAGLDLYPVGASACSHAKLSIPLQLEEGLNTWDLDLDTGSLLVSGLATLDEIDSTETDGSGSDYWMAFWEDELSGAMWKATLKCGPSGTLQLQDVPAGTITVRQFKFNEPVVDSELKFQLASGEIRNLDLGT